MKKLVLITSHFPYKKSESFLEHELPHLCTEFDQVQIITRTNYPLGEPRLVPSNCDIIVCSSKSTFLDILTTPIAVVRNIKKAVSLFQEEYNYLKSHHLFNLSNCKIALNQGFKALQFKGFLDDNILIKGEHITLYAYWANTWATAISLIDRNQVTTVCRGHGSDIYRYSSNKKYLPFREYIFGNLNHIFTVSDSGKMYLQNEYNAAPEDITIARLGTPAINHSFNKVNETTFNIVSCAFVKPVKRLHLIVAILTKIPDKIKVKWTHIGGGSDLVALKQLASTNLPSNVSTHFTGNRTSSEIQAFYETNQCDMFINVSSSEGVPVSIMEALSAGIPAVATDVGGVNEIIDITCGFLIKKDFDITEVANLICSYIQSDSAKKNKLRIGALVKWNTNYNANINYKKFARQLRTN